MDRRRAALDRAIDELRKQLRDIEKQLRALRRSPEGGAQRGFNRNGEAGRDAALAYLTEEAEQDLQRLRDMHAFVGAFRDGKLSREEFLAGPSVRDPEDLDLGELLADPLGFAQTTAAPSRSKAKGKSRAKRSK